MFRSRSSWRHRSDVLDHRSRVIKHVNVCGGSKQVIGVNRLIRCRNSIHKLLPRILDQDPKHTSASPKSLGFIPTE